MRHEGLGGLRLAGRLPWPRSLWSRLLAAAVCLAAGGAAAMMGACGLAARGYLMAQADGQLHAYAAHLTGHALVATPWSGPAPGAAGGRGPGGTVSIEVRGASGQLVLSQDRGMRAGQAIPAVSAGAAARAGQPATVPAGGGSWRVIAVPVHYRVRRLPFTYGSEDVAVLITSRARPGLDGTLVAGLDLAGIGRAARMLAVTGMAASGVVILCIGCLAAVVIRAILRPVRMAEQAVAAAAAGDLASRVPEGHARSQPGSLACSVNPMLTQIEQALTACAGSESAARESAGQTRQIIIRAGHQLRRPVSIINGAAASYAHRGQPRTGELDRIMRQVTDQAARIEALTDELLRTGHGQPPAPWR